MYRTLHYTKIIQGFEEVLSALKILCVHIQKDLNNYPVKVDNGEGQFIQEKRKVIYALQHFSPLMNLTPQETFACPGAVGATLQTLQYIDAVNKAKDKFKQLALKYQAIFKANPTKPVRQILAHAGYGGVKLKQVYRHIKYITFHPKRIAWTKTKNARRETITLQKAESLLYKIGKGRHIDVQLRKLSSLNKKDKLVIHYPIKPIWSVNVTAFKKNIKNSKNLRFRQISLPLFYLYNATLPEPNVCFSQKIKRLKVERADKKIESKPFLKSINVYRYKNFSK